MFKIMASLTLALAFITWGEGQPSNAAGFSTLSSATVDDPSLSTPTPFELERMDYFGGE
jgi:hypothetical protein